MAQSPISIETKMNVTIREVNPDTDFVPLAPNLSEAWAEPISVKQL